MSSRGDIAPAHVRSSIRGSRRAGAPVSSARRTGRGVPSRGQLAEVQRSRLLAAAVRSIDEFGYIGATVARISSRARVSRRTFYDLFDNREGCFTAVLDDVLSRIGAEIAAAEVDGLVWRERVRGGLWVILSFFDSEPELARICVVQALHGGQGVLERRVEILAGLAEIVDEGRLESQRATGCTPLIAEGLVGAAFTILYARLLRGERKPLAGLLGELMGMIVLPYEGPAAARRERARTVPAPLPGARRKPVRVASDPLEGIPMRLTYRTARVLACIAECPGASNRRVADDAGIQDQGQVSKLLARLERLGLLANTGEGHLKGEPNAWTLTAKGRQVAQSVHMRPPDRQQAA